MKRVKNHIKESGMCSHSEASCCGFRWCQEKHNHAIWTHCQHSELRFFISSKQFHVYCVSMCAGHPSWIATKQQGSLFFFSKYAQQKLCYMEMEFNNLFAAQQPKLGSVNYFIEQLQFFFFNKIKELENTYISKVNLSQN